MPKIRDIIHIIEEFAPLELQEDYDNCGLICGNPENELKNLVITLDLTMDVLNEAIDKKCNLIIEHHPTVFFPIKKIDINTIEGKILHTAIENKIAIYAAHTNVDGTKDGLNDLLMENLALINVKYIDSENHMSGRIGELKNPMTLKEFFDRVRNVLKDDNMRVVGNPEKIIRFVGAVNGGGGDERYMNAAFRAGADIFLSADFKYHVLRLAKESGYAIISFGHYESEIGFVDLVAKKLAEKKMGEYIVLSEKNMPPYGFLGGENL